MADSQTCYYPNSSISIHDTPCHSPSIGDRASACCNHLDICLDNNLCLAQGGAELVSRGSCTDKSWQSPECPQYCNDVNPGGGALIFLYGWQEKQAQFLSCCSQVNPFNNTCMTASKGSTAPFFIEAGLVIFNRTSGSTSPNTTNTATVTVTATATPLNLPSGSSSVQNTSISSSSSKETAIGAGLGVTLGLGLLVTFGLLWKQRKHKQSLSKDVQTWEGKYRESVKTKTVYIREAEHQSVHQFDGRSLDGSDGQTHLPPQLEGWIPGEVDGTEIYGVKNKTERI